MPTVNTTKPLQFSASAIALLTLLTYTNLLPALITNVLITLIFTVIYFVYSSQRGGFKPATIIAILIAFGIIAINRNPGMISLVLIWFIYDFAKYTEFDIRAIAKSFIKVAIPGYILVVMAFLTIGLNRHANLEMWRINKLISRLSLGFMQPNISMMYALAIVMAITVAYKMTYIKAFSILSVTTLLYHVNQSRTAYFLIIALVLMTLFNLKPIWIRGIFLSIAGLSFAVVVLPINQDLNALLSGRLDLYEFYRTTLGVHLLYNPLTENTMLDNSYIQMVLAKGIIFTIFFMISLLIILKTNHPHARRLALIYMISAFPETTFLHFDLLLLVILLCGQQVRKPLPNYDATYQF